MYCGGVFLIAAVRRTQQHPPSICTALYCIVQSLYISRYVFCPAYAIPQYSNTANQ
jgi:hypothetical protein